MESSVIHLIHQDRWDLLLRSLLHNKRLCLSLFRQDRLGRTPLHYACQKKGAPAEVVRLLLESARNWKDIWRLDTQGNTILHMAAACGNAEVTKVVLQQRSARYAWQLLSFVNHNQITPLRMAWYKHLVNDRMRLFGDVDDHEVMLSPTVQENIHLLHRARSVDDLLQDHYQDHPQQQQQAAADRLRDLWRKTHFICCTASSSHGSNCAAQGGGGSQGSNSGGKTSFPLHTLTAVGGDHKVQCPTVALWLATRLYPKELSHRNPRGDLPLHIAASVPHEWRSIPQQTLQLLPVGANQPVLALMADAFPRAARIPDRRGRWAIHLAINAGKSFDTGMKRLIQAAPESLETIDPVTKLYPFLQAASHDSRATLTTVFELLCAKPDLVRPRQDNNDNKKQDEKEETDDDCTVMAHRRKRQKL